MIMAEERFLKACSISIRGPLDLKSAGSIYRWLIDELKRCSELEIDVSQARMDLAGVQLMRLVETEAERAQKKVRFVGAALWPRQ